METTVNLDFADLPSSEIEKITRVRAEYEPKVIDAWNAMERTGWIRNPVTPWHAEVKGASKHHWDDWLISHSAQLLLVKALLDMAAALQEAACRCYRITIASCDEYRFRAKLGACPRNNQIRGSESNRAGT